MDCAELLSHVEQLETTLPEFVGFNGNFGHASPPQIHMSSRLVVGDPPEDDDTCFVAVATTRRSVSAQLLYGGERTTTKKHTEAPIEVLRLSNTTTTQSSSSSSWNMNKDEELSCTVVLTLDKTLRKKLKYKEEEASSIVHVAVVVGTTYTRVLSVELVVDTSTGSIQRLFVDDQKDDDPTRTDAEPSSSSSFCFEPIPADPKDTTKSHTTTIKTSSSGSNLDSIANDDEDRRRGGTTTTRSHKDKYSRSSNMLSQSQHGTPAERSPSVVTKSEISTTDREEPQSMPENITPEKEKEMKQCPFRPTGGISTMDAYDYELRDGKSRRHAVWIAYGDGTIIRLHRAAFFPTIVRHPNLLEKLLQIYADDVLVRSRVVIPNYKDDHHDTTTATTPPSPSLSILPLPKCHPTLLAPPPSMKNDWGDESTDAVEGIASSASNSEIDSSSGGDEHFVDTSRDCHEALVYGDGSTTSTGIRENLPVFAFFSSEVQLGNAEVGNGNDTHGESKSDHELLGAITSNVIGGTKAIVGGVFGVAVGAVKWGLGGSSSQNKKAKTDDDLNLRNHHDLGGGSNSGSFDSSLGKVESSFPSIHKEPISLGCGVELHDAPRQITSISIDPEGNLAAAADTLGRVMLIDLFDKQIVRMWKGVREASCFWIQTPKRDIHSDDPWKKKYKLYLVIHSKQRRTVDIWRTQQGPRVKSIQVERNAQIVQCNIPSSHHGPLAKCFVVHSTAPGTPDTNRIEALDIENDMASVTSSGTNPTQQSRSLSRSKAAVRLQLLKQMLSETNVPSSTDAVFETFTQITSLTDLCSALDLLAVAKQLEENMGVDGASFHATAISHCRKKLTTILSESEGDVFANPHVKLFLSKIKYHTQIIDAYEVLHHFETQSLGFDSEEDDEGGSPQSSWCVEAQAWIETHETVTGTSIDAHIGPPVKDALRFWSFSKACSAPSESDVSDKQHAKIHIHFTDSTRSRTEILVHIFRPFLQDVFAYKTVNSIFDRLGLGQDYDYLCRCFGEWFMTLPTKVAAQKSFYNENSPMVRWLQEIVIDRPPQTKTLLESLYKFCEESEDLPRAFLLAALCRQAISAATKQLEEKTYGLIPWSSSVHPYDTLLRKLRVCMLVSLRLYGMPLGAFPITVKNVDEGEIFSVFEWVARDELLTSHDHDEITTLETACKSSGLVSHPSLPEDDSPLRWTRLQRVCIAVANQQESLSSLSLSSSTILPDEKPGALLLYLSEYNQPGYLVAHRALLLSVSFGQHPTDLQILEDATRALRALEDYPELSAMSAAVRVEVWQNQLRPVYRAILFGFEDVPELREEILAPLVYENTYWLNEFHRMALEILTMIAGFSWDDPQDLNEQFKFTLGDESSSSNNNVTTTKLRDNTDQQYKEQSPWPPAKNDVILQRIVERPNRFVKRDSLNLHMAVVCGALASDDLVRLSDCVPDLYEAFQTTSLFTRTDESSYPSGDDDDDDSGGVQQQQQRTDFIERAILLRANRVTSSSLDPQQQQQQQQQDSGTSLMETEVDTLDLEEIDTLATIWNIPSSFVKTMFLLSVYELSKDSMVDSLTTNSLSKMDVPMFVSHALDICCRRLQHILWKLQRSSPLRHYLSMLDADTCQYIRDRAEESMSLCQKHGIYPSGQPQQPQQPQQHVSITHTHSFVLRLLSLVAVGAPQERVMVHSLSILTGTLMKAGLAEERDKSSPARMLF